jgi:hypothetical protein
MGVNLASFLSEVHKLGLFESRLLEEYLDLRKGERKGLEITTQRIVS